MEKAVRPSGNQAGERFGLASCSTLHTVHVMKGRGQCEIGGTLKENTGVFMLFGTFPLLNRYVTLLYIRLCRAEPLSGH